jgi:Basophilic leukemia-expressed protein Bles03
MTRPPSRRHSPRKHAMPTVTQPRDDPRQPSTVTDTPWLYVDAPRRNDIASDSSGKWMVFVPTDTVDEYWALIKNAVRKGWLGQRAKVATAYDNPHTRDPAERPIIVYTRDWRDHDDVERVLCGIRGLGIGWRLSYKTDQATTERRYDRGAARYVSQAGSLTFDDRSTTPEHK